MATKTEERLRLMLDEYLDTKQQKQQKEVMEHIYSIFCWGVVFGVLLSYMSIFPLLFGSVIGYLMSQKRWLMMEYWMDQWKPWIEVGQRYWKQWLGGFKYQE